MMKRLIRPLMERRVIRLERQLLLMRLRRISIQVLDWDTKKPFDQAAGAALARPPAWLRAVGRAL